MPYDIQLGLASIADMAYGGNAVQQLQNLRQAQAQQEEYQAGKARAENMRNVLSRVRDPEQLKAAAWDMMQSGDEAGAMQLLEAYKNLTARPAASSTIGKIQADIDAGLIDPETGAAALKKATTIPPVYDPVTQRLIYAGGMAEGSGTSMPTPQPTQTTTPDYYGGGTPEPTQVPLPAELPDDSANLVEQALAQIPPELATENPALYQKMASDLTKDIPKQKQTMIGKKKFESSINQLEDVLKMGMEKGFLTSENKSLTQNILNRGFATESGKLAADFIGNDRATFLQVVDGVRSSITTNMMQAYGLGATQLNTLREMEMLLKQAVNGTLTEQASKKLIGLMREREGFAPRYDRSAIEAEMKRRGLVK